ncbi:hypothetical protein EAF00_009500 [Botryotinia globosa]|nr:hypothetical protein EAF00_009500 [Botryotinia globosa]
MSHSRWKGKARQEDNGSRNEGYDRNAEAREYQQNVDQYPAPVQQSAGYQTAYGEGGGGGGGYADPAVYSRPLPQWQEYAQPGPAPPISEEASPFYQGSPAYTGGWENQANDPLNPNLLHPQPVRLAPPPQPQYSSGVNTITSSMLRASIVDPQDVAYLAPGARAGSTSTTSHTHGSWPPTNPLNTPRPLTGEPSVSYEDISIRSPAHVPLEEGELPYGEDDYPKDWQSFYDPGFDKSGGGPVHVLWYGVWETDAEMKACQKFDHVDLYRLMYIVTTLRSSVDCWINDEICLQMTVTILNQASRPRGFFTVTKQRPKGGNFTFDEVRELFRILANRKNPKRDKAVSRLRPWIEKGNEGFKKKIAKERTQQFYHPYTTLFPLWSPKRLIQGLPEMIISHLHHDNASAAADWRLCWQWRPNAFLYCEKPTENHVWYIPTTVHSPPFPPEARTWPDTTPSELKAWDKDWQEQDPREVEAKRRRDKRDADHKKRGHSERNTPSVPSPSHRSRNHGSVETRQKHARAETSSSASRPARKKVYIEDSRGNIIGSKYEYQ